MDTMESNALLSDITMDPSSSEAMDFTFIQPPELKKGYPVVVRAAATIARLNTNFALAESGWP